MSENKRVLIDSHKENAENKVSCYIKSCNLLKYVRAKTDHILEDSESTILYAGRGQTNIFYERLMNNSNISVKELLKSTHTRVKD